MIPSSMVAAEQELRRVIERRHTGDMSKCIAAYGETARNQVESRPPGDPVRLEICERVLAVLDWALLMLHTHRSTLAEDVRVLQKAHCFLGAELPGREPSGIPRFRMDL